MEGSSVIRFHNYAEYLSHWLFKAIRKTAMDQAGWRCQICKIAPASEVHHTAYPKPWGTFDAPGNIQPICHACHCRLEEDRLGNGI